MFKSLIVFIFLGSTLAQAKVVCADGAYYDDTLVVTTPSNQQVRLFLNGAGIKKALFIKIFSSALYLEAPTSDPANILNTKKTKVGMIHAMQNISKEQLVSMWNKEFNRLCGSQCANLKSYHQQFLNSVRRLGKNQTLALLFFANSLELEVDGVPIGAAIESHSYAKVLLRVFIGPDAIDKELEAGLLGKKMICNKV